MENLIFCAVILVEISKDIWLRRLIKVNLFTGSLQLFHLHSVDYFQKIALKTLQIPTS